MKLTAKQIQIIKLMREGHPMLIGQSETSASMYYQIAIGYTHENVFFRSDTFARLLNNGLIHQYGNYYELTKLGETCELK